MALDIGLPPMRKGPRHSEVNAQKDEHDVHVLARLGKKSVLARRFSFISICGFTSTILLTWEGVLSIFTIGLTNGGYAGLVYGYLFVWIGTLSLFTTMAEMASMAPTSGGQYHWVSQLAPPSIRKFSSYIMGWLVICGWQALLSGDGYLCGRMLQDIIVLNYPQYNAHQWQGTLLFWAAIVLAVFINTVASRLLPHIETMILVVHFLGFFGILIPIVYLAPEKASTHDVFTVFSNGGDWPTQGLSFFVGLTGTVYAMFGCDSAVHMAEEVRNADIVVPWSMVITTLINGALGFGILIAVLFVTVDINAILESAPAKVGYPVVQIVYDATGSLGGATTMIAILVFLLACCTMATLATASRLVWAFARDRGLPFWSHVSKVEMGSSTPMYAIIICSIVACAIGLINIGSPAAFQDVISLSVTSLYASYILTESLLLYRRVTGGIKPRLSADDKIGPGQLTWGRFHIPGVFGIALNMLSVCFGLIIFFFSFWPTARAPTPQTMNYSSLMTWSVVIFAVVYYLVYARKVYKGPIVEVFPYEMGQTMSPVNGDSKISQ